MRFVQEAGGHGDLFRDDDVVGATVGGAWGFVAWNPDGTGFACWFVSVGKRGWAWR